MSAYKIGKDMDIEGIEIYSTISLNLLTILLFLFNVAFMFFGLLFLLMGFWMKSDFENYLKISTQYSVIAPHILIVIGGIIILTAAMSLTCVLKLDASCLTVYGTFLMLLMFTLISSSIYIYEYKNQLIAGVPDGIRREILSYNANEQSLNNSLIDSIQKDLHCCGEFGQIDWINTTLPKSCCPSGISTCDINNTMNIHKEGCEQKLKDIIKENLSQIGFITCIFSILPLLCMVIAFSVSSMDTKVEYEILA